MLSTKEQCEWSKNCVKPFQCQCLSVKPANSRCPQLNHAIHQETSHCDFFFILEIKMSLVQNHFGKDLKFQLNIQKKTPMQLKWPRANERKQQFYPFAKLRFTRLSKVKQFTRELLRLHKSNSSVKRGTFSRQQMKCMLQHEIDHRDDLNFRSP